MAAVVTGSKTSVQDVSPGLPAATINGLWATAPENMTVAQLHQLWDACNHVAGGNEPGNVLGALFP
jgi:hypothetical protein